MEEDEKPTVSGVSNNLAKAIQQEEITAARTGRAYQQVFKGRHVGISISNSEDLAARGFSQVHLQDAMCEFARYFLAYGATLVYGGDLRQGGFTYTLSELAKLYSSRNDKPEERLVSYLAWPLHLQLARKQELEWKHKVKVIKLPPPPGAAVDNDILDGLQLPENRYWWSQSLTLMRNELARDCDFRILMGGAIRNFSGRLPGVLEEAWITIKMRKPIYLIGAFGGATTAIIQAIQGLKVETLHEEYQLTQVADANYKAFMDYIKSQGRSDEINYDQIRSDLADLGLTGLSKLNGLTEAENQRLFVTPHITEMIYLVLKGVKSIC